MRRTLVLIVLAALCGSVRAAAVDRFEIEPGDTVISEILRPGEFDEFVLRLPRGSTATLTFGRTGAGNWLPSAALFDSAYSQVPMGPFGSAGIRNLNPLGASGVYRVLATGFDRTVGGFRVRTRVKTGRKFALSGKAKDPAAPRHLRFGALEGASIAVRIKWRGDQPVTLRHLTGPDGAPLVSDAPAGGSSTSFSQAGFTAPGFGDHLLALDVPEGTRSWSAQVTVDGAFPRGTTRDVRGQVPPGRDSVSLAPTQFQPVVTVLGEAGGTGDFGMSVFNGRPDADFVSPALTGPCDRTPLELGDQPSRYLLRCRNGYLADIRDVVHGPDGLINGYRVEVARSPAGSGSAVLGGFEYDADLQASAWTETRTYHSTGNTHILAFSDIVRLTRTFNFPIRNDATSGKGLLGPDVAVPAGTSFTDPDADFVAANVAPGMYLELVTRDNDLKGEGAEAALVNVGQIRIVAVTTTELTLAAPLAAEAPLPGRHFEYRVGVNSFPVISYRLEHTAPDGAVRRYDFAPIL